MRDRNTYLVLLNRLPPITNERLQYLPSTADPLAPHYQ